MKGTLPTAFGNSVLEVAVRAARSDAPVLICGETGSGKTVLARYIHDSSGRSYRPFLRTDCASIPESLFEREVFGHTRGAFTDARDSQPGLFEAVDGGTLFLDEVGEFPRSVQPKLLSVLDDGLVRRIGSTNPKHVDVRIVSATNRDLAELVKAREFRADLYHRLAFLKISIPPLRRRLHCIPELAAAIVRRLTAQGVREGQSEPELHPDTIAHMQAYAWPGNVRELEQALTFALTFFPSPVLRPEHLPPEIRNLVDRTLSDQGTRATTRRYAPPDDPEAERIAVMRALEISGGNRTRATRLLGMSRATLWVKLRHLETTRVTWIGAAGQPFRVREAQALHHVLVVVPCYNEQARLPTEEFRRFAQEHPAVRFLFVDDGSTDRTQDMLLKLCRTSPSAMRALMLERHAGKAEAVRRGILKALQATDVWYVGFWDADLATPLDAITKFLEVLKDHGHVMLVMGARVQLLGRRISRRPHRRFASRLFATAVSAMLSAPVYDTQCGAKLFRVNGLTHAIFHEPFATGWAFDVEILARMTRLNGLARGQGIKELVYEVPLVKWQDVTGSKRRLLDYVVALRDLLLIRHQYLRGLSVSPRTQRRGGLRLRGDSRLENATRPSTPNVTTIVHEPR